METAPNHATLQNNQGDPKPVLGRYSVKIRSDANLPLRSYAVEWRTVNAAEAALYQNLVDGEDVCFWYSEDDWYGSDTTFGVSHTTIRAGLTGLNDTRVVKCADGAAPTRI